jgi:serine/threonine-protein kinase
MGYCTLRRIELVLFGSLAAFFGWLQVAPFPQPDLFYGPARYEHIEVARHWLTGSAMRWFFLIVAYGVFIPNTWRRCAAIVGSAAALPVVLTSLAAWWFERGTDEVLLGILDLAILMGTGVAVAVFGSHRLEVLRREAFRAQQLGQYRLKGKLGAGGMGEVHLAEHVLLRRPCAIKLIRPEQLSDPGALPRFEREVQAMATLTSPYSVEVYDYGRADDGTFYYVMEYLPGQTLESLVERHGPLPAARAVHFLRQVCRALREAHSIGLLHRDIKPSNVIACERGGVYDVAKLLDFGLVQDTGLAAASDRLTVVGTILGSPPYMSPEQAAGKADLDATTDIYAVGGVGYYLLTGRAPFVRETPLEVLLAHAYEEPAPPGKLREGVPDDVQAVVLRCLAKKPADRYHDAASLEQALAACAVASEWGEEQAAAWWKSRPAEAETSHSMPALTTTPGT